MNTKINMNQNKLAEQYKILTARRKEVINYCKGEINKINAECNKINGVLDSYKSSGNSLYQK